jgi:hypothetical protein
VEPLLVLLCKGVRWNWTNNLQQAFEILRSRLAENIHIVHPNEDKGYIINTHASGRAVGSILMQHSDDGKLTIISTTPRVLNLAEQGYATCEKKNFCLLFMPLTVLRSIFTDTKLSLTPTIKLSHFSIHCLARWMVEISQFDVDIWHIKGVQHHLADILSPSPSGLTDEETRNLTRSDRVMIHRVQLYEEKSMEQDLQTLATLQDIHTTG